jgi:N-acetylmuramoyl-L-alanine amidase
MKKILFAFALLTILLFACFSFASADTFESELNSDNIIIKRTVESNVLEIKSIAVIKINGKDYFKIRELSDACGAAIEWIDETKSIKVNSNDYIMLFKYNSNEIFINGTLFDFGTPVLIEEGISYAPVSIYKAFTGEWNSNSVITSGSKNDITQDNHPLLTVQKGIDSDRITVNVKPENIIADFKLNNPPRIVLDLTDVNFSGESPEGNTFKQIRYSKNNGVTRLVFDLTEDYIYRLNANGSNFIIDISDNGKFVAESTNIEFRNNSVILETSNYTGYTVRRTSDPFSIIVFIPDTLVSNTTEVPGNGNLVESIIAAPYENGTIISIITTAQCAFELEKLENNFIIGVYEPVVRNLEYHNIDNAPYIELTGTGITSDSDLSIEYKSNSTYITFTDSNNSLTVGQVYINDGFVKNIFVTKNSNKTTVRIDGIEKIYPAFGSFDGKTVLYLNANDYSGRLVVISAGHGGRDPGAIANDIHEADINLSIALKLNDMLVRLGVDTLMIRKDDTFYSLEERVIIANENKAALFISIHSNALEDPEFDGIMTLVHSGAINYKKINGRTAGEIIHKHLIEATGATDRNVRFRDKIIVLKDTAMPAVEIEAGFLTNEAELSKLIDDTYQTIIAAAAADGIIEVLKYIN